MPLLVQYNHHTTTFHQFAHHVARRFLLDSTTLCTTVGVDAVGLAAAPSVTTAAESITSRDEGKKSTCTRPEPEPDGAEGGAAAATPQAAMGPMGLASSEPRVDASGAEASASVFVGSTADHVEGSGGAERIWQRGYVEKKISGEVYTFCSIGDMELLTCRVLLSRVCKRGRKLARSQEHVFEHAHHLGHTVQRHVPKLAGFLAF